DVPQVLGGRGTLLAAAFGGFEGRALRRGDVLPVGGATGEAQLARDPPLDLDAPVRVRAGPDLDRFGASALPALLAGPWKLSPASDRTGTRLEGPALERADSDAAVSAPMVPGAIQVPKAG